MQTFDVKSISSESDESSLSSLDCLLSTAQLTPKLPVEYELLLYALIFAWYSTAYDSLGFKNESQWTRLSLLGSCCLACGPWNAGCINVNPLSSDLVTFSDRFKLSGFGERVGDGESDAERGAGGDDVD